MTDMTRRGQTKFEFPNKPGRYNYRAAGWLPKVKVSVFMESIKNQGELRMRYAGIILKPGHRLAKGIWEGPLVS